MSQAAVSLSSHPASLPKADIGDGVDKDSVIAFGLDRLSSLQISDLAGNAIWRDSLALTGTLRTFYSPNTVVKTWLLLSDLHRPGSFAAVAGSAQVVRLSAHTSWVEARFEFRINGSRPATCSGTIGIVPDASGAWKIWLLSTILERLDGYPDVDELTAALPRKNGGERLDGAISRHVECVIIGAGIGGLTMAARLQSLNVSYIVIEAHDRVGDNWLHDRYESLKLHTSKAYNQLPGYPPTFGPDASYNLTAREMADGLQRFVETFDIPVLTSTVLDRADWSAHDDGWDLHLRSRGSKLQMTARHVVLATGNMGTNADVPQYPNRDVYRGDVIPGGLWKNAQRWTGGKGVVIGSANTAHGVIADMVDAGFETVTMIQRSKTFLLPIATFSGLVDPIYNDSVPLGLSDRILMGPPLPVQRLIAIEAVKLMAAQNPEYFDRIETRGFNIERNGDLWGMLYDREGGHFFDLGSGELIADGRVRVLSGATAAPVSYTPSGIELSHGTRLDADVLVLATGYRANILPCAKKIFGDRIGKNLREFWQCDAEGEIRGAWRHSGHPRIWYTGHGYAHARYYSRFVAMHIKSEVQGHSIQMYMDTPS